MKIIFNEGSMEAIVMIEEASKVPLSKLLWLLAQCGIIDQSTRLEFVWFRGFSQGCG